MKHWLEVTKLDEKRKKEKKETHKSSHESNSCNSAWRRTGECLGKDGLECVLI